MTRSRTEAARERRLRRRKKLMAANAVLLAAIAAVVVWNIYASALQRDNAASVETVQGTGRDRPGASAAPEHESDPVPQTPAEPRRVNLAFVGDILLGEYVGTLLKRDGYHYPYEHVREQLQAADIAAANLETAVTDIKEKPEQKTYEFRSEPQALPALKEAGFDLVSLANNHVLDFGTEGLFDTIKHLEEQQLLYVGAGKDADEAYKPVIVERNGIRVAYVSFSRVVPFVEWKAGRGQAGVAETYDHRRPVETIRAAKQEADVVVVLVHWGEERMLTPEPDEQVELGHRFIDAGADLVIGSHPHVLQGFERYKDRWIAYSLGNFIFTKSLDPLTYDSGILEASCEKGGDCELQLTPYRVDTPQPRPMEPEERTAVWKRLSELSVNAIIEEDGRIAPASD